MITQHLIVPVVIDGNRYCCDPETRTTDPIVTGSVTITTPGTYEFGLSEGSFKFGVCCGSNVNFAWSGTLESGDDPAWTVKVEYDATEFVFSGASPSANATIDAGAALGETDISLVDGSGNYKPCGWVFEVIYFLEDFDSADVELVITVT
jgi:hypothetical protein